MCICLCIVYVLVYYFVLIFQRYVRLLVESELDPNLPYHRQPAEAVKEILDFCHEYFPSMDFLACRTIKKSLAYWRRAYF